LVNRLSPEEFRAKTHVSRETLTRLELYAGLLQRWQKSINLVSDGSIEDLWRRHFLDSAQLAPLIPAKTRRMADLGSGAGFPGLVLAIMAVGIDRVEVHLIESDGRKCAFLQEVIRATGAPALVRQARIEAIAGERFELLTARGLAPLDRLLAYAEPLLAPGGLCLFLKGRRLDEELTITRDKWKMGLDRFPSSAEAGGEIVRIGEIALVRAHSKPAPSRSARSKSARSKSARSKLD
jgi:16S rRNA (guanine527-N7)-methyltransferase